MSVKVTRRAGTAAAGAAVGVSGGARAPRHVLVGVGLMVGFGLLFAAAGLRADPAVPVLAVARPVAAGGVLGEADLRVVDVVPGAVELVAASQRDAVVGRRAAVPLVAGSLLSPGQLGAAASWPPVGRSVVAVPVATGRVPAGLSAGSAVSVLLPGDGAGGQQGGQPAQPAPGVAVPGVGVAVPGVVVAVEAPDVAGIRVVSLLLTQAGARQVAAAGELVLVLESPGSGG